MKKSKDEITDSVGPITAIVTFSMLFVFIPLFGGLTGSFNELPAEFLWLLDIILIIIAIFCQKYIKTFVLNVSRNILDFCTTLDIISTITIIIAGFYFKSTFEMPLWWFIVGAIAYFIIATMKNYVIYLLIDIRDSLKKIADNSNKKGE